MYTSQKAMQEPQDKLFVRHLDYKKSQLRRYPILLSERSLVLRK
jgi:hypothetical protein